MMAFETSGNLLSPHYDDLLAVWRRGEGVPLPWSAAEIARRTCSTFTRVPA